LDKVAQGNGSVPSPITTRTRRLAAGLAATVLVLGHGSAMAADAKPYDAKLFRLSEILGAVHYLRELCGANDGQLWRDRMRELMEAEGSSALRRARLTRSFNDGYTSFSRTYRTCTPSALTTVTRYLTEGTQISEALVKAIP
jgi:uncharacterized protein (TIGR02301 family)